MLVQLASDSLDVLMLLGLLGITELGELAVFIQEVAHSHLTRWARVSSVVHTSTFVFYRIPALNAFIPKGMATGVDMVGLVILPHELSKCRRWA